MLPPPPFALFDDNLSDAGDLLLHGLQQTLRCHAVDEIAATFAAIDAARREGLWVAIAIDYEFGHLLEARLRACARPSPGARPLLTARTPRAPRRISTARRRHSTSTKPSPAFATFTRGSARRPTTPP